MTRWKLPVLAALLAVAACDGAPTAPAAAEGIASPSSPSFHHGPVTIQAPFSVSTPQAVTATASITGSWRYKWEYRWCSTGSVPGDCNYVWRAVADGQDITSITKNVYQWDRWVEFRVTILDAYGHVMGYDEHRVYGPSAEVMEPVDVCDTQPCGWQ